MRVSHGKAAEYQARGAVHFHVLIRLDGLDDDDPGRLLLWNGIEVAATDPVDPLQMT